MLKYFAIAGIILSLGYLLWGGLESNVVYFVTPTELSAKGNDAVGSPVRLGGVVETGTINFQETLLTFKLKDEEGGLVAVRTTKAPPQMFQEEIGVVVEGSLQRDGTFEAERLMVKHGNEYRAPEEGEMPQEVYKSLQNN